MDPVAFPPQIGTHAPSPGACAPLPVCSGSSWLRQVLLFKGLLFSTLASASTLPLFDHLLPEGRQQGKLQELNCERTIVDIAEQTDDGLG